MDSLYFRPRIHFLTMLDISSKEYNPYYQSYINSVQEKDIYKALLESKSEFIEALKNIPEEKLSFAYQTGKWTVAELILHIFDTERVFAYRALRFGRNDKTPLQGFEQDDFIPYSNAEGYTKQRLEEEYEGIRHNSLVLFKNFNEEMLQRVGEASGSKMSARAAGYIIVGHQKHHLTILKDRYL